jgi:hypothetical protein
MSASHWYLLPVGCLIAVLAMSSGISAGNRGVCARLWRAHAQPGHPAVRGCHLLGLGEGRGEGLHCRAGGGTVHGMITVGLGELMLPSLLGDRKLYNPAEAVGSTVLVIFATSLAAAMVRLHGLFLTALGE